MVRMMIAVAIVLDRQRCTIALLVPLLVHRRYLLEALLELTLFRVRLLLHVLDLFLDRHERRLHVRFALDLRRGRDVVRRLGAAHLVRDIVHHLRQWPAEDLFLLFI